MDHVEVYKCALGYNPLIDNRCGRQPCAICNYRVSQEVEIPDKRTLVE
jgi:hypothetical protein